MSGHRIVLTADRTLMSSYGGGIFYGFIATAPARGFLPLPLLLKFVFKPVPVGPRGEALLAPHGLRRIESALLESGIVEEDEIIVAPPETLERIVGEETRIIGIYSHDHLGRGPASTTFSGPTGIVHEEPLSAWGFRTLVTSSVVQRARKRGAVVVAGGPGAWQFTYEDMERLGVDLVVYGEGEKVVPELFSAILSGEELGLPKIVYVDPSRIPRGCEIPPLKGATVGGLVEVSRGCGRMCSFCRPTLVPLRHRPLEHIVRDVMVNVRCGQRSICLHAEDVFRYGAGPLEVKREKVVELFDRVSKVPGARITSISHANLSSIAAYPRLVEEVSELLGLDKRNWMGYQTGIETGSPRLIEMHMEYKPYPFKPSEWPEVVEQAFATSVDCGLVPAATLIVNLPGETEDDVLATVELVERLRPYKSLMVPLLYVPADPREKMMRFLEDAQWYHWELYRVVWRHNMRWLPTLAVEYTTRSDLTTKLFMRSLISMVTKIADRKVESFIERNLVHKLEEHRKMLLAQRGVLEGVERRRARVRI